MTACYNEMKDKLIPEEIEILCKKAETAYPPKFLADTTIGQRIPLTNYQPWSGV